MPMPVPAKARARRGTAAMSRVFHAAARSSSVSRRRSATNFLLWDLSAFVYALIATVCFATSVVMDTFAAITSADTSASRALRAFSNFHFSVVIFSSTSFLTGAREKCFSAVVLIMCMSSAVCPVVTSLLSSTSKAARWDSSSYCNSSRNASRPSPVSVAWLSLARSHLSRKGVSTIGGTIFIFITTGMWSSTAGIDRPSCADLFQVFAQDTSGTASPGIHT
eukprot:67710-Pyramimonas_sp.AAC.2